jgi:hypothetical protein
MLVALVLGQTPAVGWREAFSRPRCDVAVCKCRDCAGGVNCCCARARTPLEQMMAQSRCDRAEQQQLALTVMPRTDNRFPTVPSSSSLAFVSRYCPAQSAAPRLLQTGLVAVRKHTACEGARY